MNVARALTMGEIADVGDIQLPTLREDIEFEMVQQSGAGLPIWTIHDPLQSKFFRIDDGTKILLSYWNAAKTSGKLAALAAPALGYKPKQDQLSSLAQFLVNSGLAESAGRGWRDVASHAQQGHQSALAQIIHGYLFFRVPLFRPNGFLHSLLPAVEPLFSRRFAFVIASMGIAGVYLVSRQWQQFADNLLSLWTPEGAAAFAICLAVAKAMHEFGHAFAAARFGCRVSTMGVAFMVMAPVLYTDVSDTWRLTAKQRMVVDAAGMAVDLGVACVALFLWSFFPEGALKSVCFVMATTGLVLSLAINLNPLMRFDGYHLFSDLLGIDNLQQRSFAFGCWKLRHILFGAQMPPPEQLSKQLSLTLVAYAWCTWIYRLFVFTGVAILVYSYFFKVLGIALFLIEIWYFILRPIWREILAWKAVAGGFAPTRTALTAAAALIAVLLALLPWSRRVEIPAVLNAREVAQLFAPRPARIVQISDLRGQFVKEGALIAELSDPQLLKDIDVTQLSIERVSQQLSRIAVDEMNRAQSLVLRRELASLKAKLAGLQKEQQELMVRAPIDGVVAQMGANLHMDRWLGKNDLIALVTSHVGLVARGYVSEADLSRIDEQSHGRFVPDDLTRRTFPVHVTAIAKTGASQIEISELSSNYDGPIAVTQDNRRQLRSSLAQYEVEMEPADVTPPEFRLRGVVELRGSGESVAAKVWRRAVQVLVREGGF